MTKKEKILKILLWVSFFPYVFLLGIGSWCGITGFTFFFSTTYGWEAFRDSIVIWGFILCTYIPLLLISLAYQIGYGIWKVVLRRRNCKIKLSENSDENKKSSCNDAEEVIE